MDCLLFNIVFCYMNCICIAKTSHHQLTKLLLKKKKKRWIACAEQNLDLRRWQMDWNHNAGLVGQEH